MECLNEQDELTEEVCVQVLPVGVGQAHSGAAVLLLGELSPIRVHQRQDYNPRPVNQLQEKESGRGMSRRAGSLWHLTLVTVGFVT